MSDTALLGHLLRELRRTTRAQMQAVGIDVAAANREQDKAEKRIFSLFDKLAKDLDAERRASATNLAAFDEVTKAFDRLKAGLVATTAPQHAPFDEAKARAGEPIQVKFDKDWYDATYVGFDIRHGCYVVNCQDIPGATSKLSYWSADAMRMKSKTQQVQMFANVYKNTLDDMWGTLFPREGEVVPLPPGRVLLAANVPVTITVTL